MDKLLSEEYPHVPAAFINAIYEEGTKDEAIGWLQKTWNELCAIRRENERLKYLMERIKDQAGHSRYVWETADKALSNKDSDGK